MLDLQLTDAGIDNARRLGEQMRSCSIEFDSFYSSKPDRCVDTIRNISIGLGLGLNSGLGRDGSAIAIKESQHLFNGNMVDDRGKQENVMRTLLSKYYTQVLEDHLASPSHVVGLKDSSS
mmetsp:Transcript_63528/g.137556  ORF Transcript_63528/g.137556 Transcript_63528/m.137556 type:complete len:120 (-) Transcript_63528:261-620(-)